MTTAMNRLLAPLLSALSILLLAVTSGPLVRASGPQDQDYATLRAEAERHFAEESYTLALRAYQQAARLDLDPSPRAWVDFRLADAGWRSLAASGNPDPSALEAARAGLESYLARYERPEERDDLFALASESLGDLLWTRPRSRNQPLAWRSYGEALDHWAASPDLDRARARYLGIVWRMIDPSEARAWERSNNAGSISEDVLLSAQRIATSLEDRARANFYLGLRGQSEVPDERTHTRTRQAFETVLELGRSTSVYADALYAYGVWLEERGRLVVDSEKGTRTEPDYVAALALYRRLMEEYREGTHEHWRSARNRIRNITGEEVSLRVGQVFLPDSTVGFGLRWRNVDTIHLSLHPVDLTEAVDLTEEEQNTHHFLASIDLARHAALRSWDLATEDAGLHEWGEREVLVEEPLEPGAYVLQARAGEARSRELILITDAALVIKAQEGRFVTWLADVFTGEPLAGAKVRSWIRQGSGPTWRVETGTSDESGLTRFAPPRLDKQRLRYFVAARSGDRQAFALAWEPWSKRVQEQWKLYLAADRAAYRPEQPVSWKLSARVRGGEESPGYGTPAGARLRWELWGPRGELHEEGSVSLNEFGSASGSMTPGKSWPLGEYQLRLFEEAEGADTRGQMLGSGQLFRLEEYKLPEFLVTVEGARDENGQPRAFRMGDDLELTVSADYYFGGPVADASCELRVFRKPFYKVFGREREFPWLHRQALSRYGRHQGQRELVSTEVLRTDADGRLRVRVETSASEPLDWEYSVEARVTDSSRREVSGSGSLKVTHQAWFAHLSSDHKLHAPGSKAEVRLAISDADDRPLARSGEVTLSRLVWREVWLDPRGRRVEGRELLEAQRARGIFPPPHPGPGSWQRIVGEYEEQPLQTMPLATDGGGEALWSFTLAEVGHYQVRFTGRDSHGAVIQTELALECIDGDTRETGLAVDRPRILLDEDTFREGQPGLVMLTTPASGRWVWFSVETDVLIEERVVFLEGNVKLLRLEVDQAWIPNVNLQLVGFHQGAAALDAHEVIVPPSKHFLDLELSLEPPVAQPGQEGTLAVRVTDADGQPVRTELTLSLVDASLAAIQEDYAPDPREFFYGDRRPHRVVTQTSMGHRRYARMVEDGSGGIEEHGRSAWLQEAEEVAEGKAGQRFAGRSSSRGPSSGGPAGSIVTGSDAFFLGAEPADSLASDAPGRQQGQAAVVVAVRSDFRETALWRPHVVTDQGGRARVTFKYPDNLTRWTARARAQSTAADFGQTTGESATRLPLLVRLQAPRFFVVGDETVVSLNIDNRTDAPLTCSPRFEVEGLELLGFVTGDDLRSALPERLELPARDGVRLDLRVRAREAGTARFLAEVESEAHGDALRRELPVHPHGIESLVVKAGRFDGSGVQFDLELPAPGGADATAFEVQVTPSLAVTMLDALPYLVDYPYGCTEQTLSRFVPTAVVAKTLEDLGLDPAEALGRVYGGIEQEHVGQTQRTKEAGLEDLAEATEDGLQRLYDFQHGDGSWSWWKHGRGDRFMTAYVVWGLSLAEEAGVEVDAGRRAQGAPGLGKELVGARNAPALASWMLHAHSAWLARRPGDLEQREFARAAFDEAFAERATTGAYARALLTLSAVALGRADEARVLAANLIDGVQRDDVPDASILPLGDAAGGTQSPRAHWGPDRIAPRRSEGGVEATAFALRALLAVDPTHELVEPAADWLIANRRGAQWSNTKTTAITVLALCDYLRRTGQLGRDVAYEVLVNGTPVGRSQLGAAELLRAPASYTVPPNLVRGGANRVELRRLSGEGPLYFSARASFFSREEPIPARGNELFLRRQYYRLVGKPTLLRGTVYDRVLLRDGDPIVSGERVEVVLTLEAKTPLEYLLFEDLKPAGFEATELRSGGRAQARELRQDEYLHRFGAPDGERGGRPARQHGERFDEGYTGRTRSLHQELRDRQVAFFLDRCPEGVWEIRYDLRAESPGTFHALPVLGEAMYVPEIRAHGAEQHVTVEDREDV